MTFAMPMPEMPGSPGIDFIVETFAWLLNAPQLVVVCQYKPTGDVIAANPYTDTYQAMLAVWECNDDVTTAGAHPSGPLTEQEENDDAIDRPGTG